MLLDAAFLGRPVSVLPRVGPAMATKLNLLGIITVNDLLYHLPFRYDDLSLMTPIATLQAGEVVTIKGKFTRLTTRYVKNGRTIQAGEFSDLSGSCQVVWFNQPFLVKPLLQAESVSLSGKVSHFNGRICLTAPQYEVRTGSPESIHTGRLVPVYHETKGVSSKWLRRLIHPLLPQLDPSLDPLPSWIKQRYRLSDLPQALFQVHFPRSTASAAQARHRLAFDELLLWQLAAQKRRQQWLSVKRAHPIAVNTRLTSTFLQALPFDLTPDQTTALDAIYADLQRHQPMHRLLQGDVGSGKTVVAAAALFACVRSHLPAVFMAPTEILALQHARTLKALLTPLGCHLSLQTKSFQDKITPTSILIGTHALLFRRLPANLGLVIIDEQHRFGVKQRGQLLARTNPPHFLSLSATPIPRTIALTLYSEVDISTITTMPPGKTPVKTWLVPQVKKSAAYDWVDSQLKQRGQAFFVCPLIDPSPHPLLDQVQAATDYYRSVCARFPHRQVDLLHGRLSSSAKAKVIDRFRSQKVDILVTTPVIEVGVDIPNATIMLIEGSERFGLASLHQLRGRVGRGSDPGYCLLFTNSPSASTRLKHLTHTHSGFALAELDLKLRGPGELFGTRQAGFVQLKIASLTDLSLIRSTHQTALELLRRDPQLARSPLLAAQIKDLLANGAATH